MKKFFGVLLWLIGLFCISLGMFGMGNTNGERKCLESQIEMIEGYQSKKDGEMMIGGSITFVGLVFSIVGIVLLATKTKKQLLMEAELEVLKNRQAS